MNEDFRNSIEEQQSETPIIIIERDDEQLPAETVKPDVKPRRRWLWMLGTVLASMLAVALLFGGYKLWRYYYHFGVPVSCSPKENIAKLKTPAKKTTAEIVMTSDSILGVRLNFYELRGVKAEISFQEPDTTDTSVYLYSRCADHNSDGTYNGSLVVGGKEYSSDVTRLGYCGIVGNQMVIGISRFEDVKEYAMKQGGSFFRQFILVSNSVMPPIFQLHGKVERRGLGRIGDKLFYIESPYPETMYAFADAIREYGFTDAIYITGGDDYSFYRTADGQRHDIGNVEKYPHKKWKGVIPWLVFKKSTDQ